MNQVVEKKAASAVPKIGAAWPEQGGIYIGSRLIDSAVHHIIIPGGTEQDFENLEFNQAAEVITGKEINGHSDWRMPDQRDLMLAYVNVPEHFNKSDWYWTGTPYGSFTAWAVGFECGPVFTCRRFSEFRVRPFRRFTY
jgi:hypothetical protein